MFTDFGLKCEVQSNTKNINSNDQIIKINLFQVHSFEYFDKLFDLGDFSWHVYYLEYDGTNNYNNTQIVFDYEFNSKA